MALSDVYVSVPMPKDLAQRLRDMADRNYSSVAATARRLIAAGMARESARVAAAEVTAEADRGKKR